MSVTGKISGITDRAKPTALWKPIVKVSVWCFGLALSLSAYAEFVGNSLGCSGDSINEYNRKIEYLKKHPNDVLMMFSTGVDALCIGKEREGMFYVEKASFSGHVAASRLTGRYYETDKTLESGHGLTKDPENFNAAIYYYERAALQIEENPRYPEGTTEDMLELEESGYISARVFDFLPYFYYKGYARAIKDILNTNNNDEYSDLIEVLVKMYNSAERCLQRPALAIWKSNRQAVWDFLQVRCGAMRDFAEEALALEPERAAAAVRCPGSLSECLEHKKIVDQLIVANRLMWDTIKTISPTLSSHISSSVAQN